MRSKIVQKILDETTLDVCIRVSNQMAFINLITELGYRENKSWDENDEKDNEILSKLMILANKHSESQMKEIEEYNPSKYKVKSK